MVYLPESEDIYFPKTKEYFNEVMSNYAIGNYRSAIVMLYSVAICDMLFKLQELRDMYDDTIAQQILEEVEKCRNTADNKSKARWEKELVDNIYSKTELLDLESYTNLNHLYDHRNFSAHPALNANYELISPSKETTIAHIRNTLDSILVKPPVFIKNIVEMLSEDLSDKQELYAGKNDQLKKYLDNKYFDRMPLLMKKKTFKALWKFCFGLPEDEKCKNNQRINRKVLEMLLEDNYLDLSEYIKTETAFSSTSSDHNCTMHLAVLMSKYPRLYSVISENSRLQIDALIESNTTAHVIAWFKHSDKAEHLQKMQEEDYYKSIEESTVSYMVEQYKAEGLMGNLVDYFIQYYANSANYDDANHRYKITISPFLDDMSREQFVAIMQAVNNNSQVYNRNASYYANTEVMQVAKAVIEQEFDFSVYPHFQFNREAVYQIQPDKEDESADPLESIDDDGELPF